MNKEWIEIPCATCGVVFCLSNKHHASLRKSGVTFYCPNGHELTYGMSEADSLRRELRVSGERYWRSLAATRGAHTRTKKRIASGLCPCCKQEFKNLAAHMRGKHPKYIKGAKK